ncbi:hypothetical protein LY28_02790 [Ruminiclostridium sufflavum DSM 19573]|uniref:HEPN domain-containing protein n=1 Tax=Ruminiclostridium sufflavum DSM 19573 TaxID=1121337 RepID=A0A318XIA8_9FIRM|nr:hypothetical protein [Ruminiclostridium sufflavum]PYG86764.1 hypothetical protein LY28_02790 [Ruminiclostridium sufflavum DSM 19573]
MQKNIGSKRNMERSIDVATCYNEIALKNYQAASILFNNRMYNEASYLYIQSMEKSVKEKICNIIDSTNPYFGKELKNIGHSVEKSIDFLISIYCRGDLILQEQMKNQICNGILKNFRFEYLNNDLRYPNYYEKNKHYSMLIISETDCREIQNMANNLNKYLKDLSRV